MEQEELERGVLASLDSPEAFVALRGAHVTEGSFVLYPQVFRFIEDYFREYQQPPSKELLEKQFSVSLGPSSQDQGYLAAQLTERELGRQLHVTLDQGISLLVDDDRPTEALAFLRTRLSQLEKHKRLTRNLTDKNALQRLDAYLEKEKATRKGLTVGLKTGLAFFDEDQLGLVPGNLLGIVGNTTVGKSWLLTYMAAAMYMDGARVLFVSPEMSLQEVEARWDPIVAAMYGLELSNLGLMRGKGINKEVYQEFLQKTQERNDWMTVSTGDNGISFTLSSIEDLIVEFRPAVVAVDGVPLIGTSSSTPRGEVWQRVADVSYGLKNLAEAKGLVVLATNQAVRQAEAREDLNLSDVGYAYAFAQACDQVVAISAPRERDNVRLVRLMKRRVGKRTLQPVEIQWDVDKGIIG